MQMHHLAAVMASLPLLASAVPSSIADIPHLSKRLDITWGPIFYLGPGTAEIVSVVTTTYPGEMPSNQAGGLFLWPGITNGSDENADLVQSIVGSYSSGQSECGTGTAADSQWCISSEMYGPDSDLGVGVYNQWVGDLRTLDATPQTGLTIKYTLIDASTYLWNQTVHDATSGNLLSTFQYPAGPMTTYNTAVECQSCTPTIADQTYVNTTITLNAADPTFDQTLYTTDDVTYSTITTVDGGITWTIDNILIPAMNSS